MEVNPNLSESAKADLELVERAKSGDQIAYGKLMSKYRQSIYFSVLKLISNKEDAEDVTMEAIGKAFNNLASYQYQYAFSTWLFRIASNASIDFLRKKKLQTTSIDAPGRSSDDDDVSPIIVRDKSLNPEEAIIKEQRAEKIRKSVAKLPEKYRQLIMMFYVEDMPYNEIAEKLDMPLGTLKAQLFRAKKLLLDDLEGHSEELH